jgi:hypothetical protein
MWVIDIRHWLNEQQEGSAAPQLRLKVKKLAEIIIWITSRDCGLPTGKTPKCWRRPKRKPCKGILKIQFEIDDQIHWFCPECEDEGLIDGWHGLMSYLSVKAIKYMTSGSIQRPAMMLPAVLGCASCLEKINTSAASRT